MSARGRAWLGFATVLAFALAVGIAWGAVMYDRWAMPYRQLPPGQGVGFVPGKDIRLISLIQTPTVLTTSYDSEKHAGAGGTFVIAVIEVVLPEDSRHCVLDLMDVEGRTWRTEMAYDLKGSPRCDDLPVGVRTRTRLVYEIPAASVPKLAGVAVSFASAEERLLLTPEAAP